MNEVATPSKTTLVLPSNDPANAVANEVQNSIQSPQQASKATAMAGDNQSQKLMQQGREMYHDALHKLQEVASQGSEMAVGYAKEEPVRALLMAAVAGALLMGMVTMIARSRD